MKRILFMFCFLTLSLPVWAQEIQGVSVSEEFVRPSEPAIMWPSEPEQVIFTKYSWADFLSGESCQLDYTALNSVSFLTQEQEKLKNEMMSYCFSPNAVWNSLKLTFRQNKKTLLMNQLQKNENFVMRYVKMLPLFLWDVHNTSPKGNTLTDNLDRIQIAIDDKRPEKVLTLMQDLSPNQQLFFMPLFNEVNRLIDFKQHLEREGK